MTQLVHVLSGVFSQQAAEQDPQPCGVEDYASALARLMTFPGPHYVLFTADRDKSSGQPWCPDCARAVPAVQRQVAHTGGTLLEVEVCPPPDSLACAWSHVQLQLSNAKAVELCRALCLLSAMLWWYHDVQWRCKICVWAVWSRVTGKATVAARCRGAIA